MACCSMTSKSGTVSLVMAMDSVAASKTPFRFRSSWSCGMLNVNAMVSCSSSSEAGPGRRALGGSGRARDIVSHRVILSLFRVVGGGRFRQSAATGNQPGLRDWERRRAALYTHRFWSASGRGPRARPLASGRRQVQELGDRRFVVYWQVLGAAQIRRRADRGNDFPRTPR